MSTKEWIKRKQVLRSIENETDRKRLEDVISKNSFWILYNHIKQVSHAS